jgi:hypothetical protein
MAISNEEWKRISEALMAAVATSSPPPSPGELPEFYSPYPILGVRSWLVTGILEGRILRGQYGADWFTPYMKAVCGHGQRHPVPAYKCACGIYARKKIGPGEVPPHSHVTGVVTMSDVIEHAHGYRAGEARLLVALCSPQNRPFMEYRYPTVELVKSSRKLDRVIDYYTKNPDRLPWPQEVQ